jgi:recombination protein RecA
MVQDKERDKALENAIAQIDRQFGKGSIMRMVDYGNKMQVESIPTGSIALDMALGGGGVPRGRVVEVYGPEASGKTTLCYHIMSEAQKMGGVAAYIDAEHAFDPEYAARCGLNLDQLLISQPDNSEQALEITETLVRSGAIDVIVIDSVAALVPRAEIEGEMGDSHVGLMARLMSQALRKLVGAVSKSRCCLIFTNQIRMKIGVMFGNPETTTGGQALKFYASVRMEIRRVESIKQGQDVSGNRVRVKVVKNKVAPPFRNAEFDIMFNEGISRIGSIVDLGTELGVLRKSGAFYSYGDQRLGQGRENVKEFLKGHPELTDEIEAQIRSTMAEKGAATISMAATSGKNGKSAPTAASDEEEDEEGEF